MLKKIKSGLYFGILITTVFIVRDYLHNDGLTRFNIISGIISGIVAGLVFGVLYGIVLEQIFKGIRQQFLKSVSLNSDEIPVYEMPASYCKGINAIGGKLFLTTDHLIFISHKYNISSKNISIPISKITSIEKLKGIGIKDGIVIKTEDSRERFIVDDSKYWISSVINTNSI